MSQERNTVPRMVIKYTKVMKEMHAALQSPTLIFYKRDDLTVYLRKEKGLSLDAGMLYVILTNGGIIGNKDGRIVWKSPTAPNAEMVREIISRIHQYKETQAAGRISSKSSDPVETTASTYTATPTVENKVDEPAILKEVLKEKVVRSRGPYKRKEVVKDRFISFGTALILSLFSFPFTTVACAFLYAHMFGQVIPNVTAEILLESTRFWILEVIFILAIYVLFLFNVGYTQKMK